MWTLVGVVAVPLLTQLHVSGLEKASKYGPVSATHVVDLMTVLVPGIGLIQ